MRPINGFQILLDDRECFAQFNDFNVDFYNNSLFIYLILRHFTTAYALRDVIKQIWSFSGRACCLIGNFVVQLSSLKLKLKFKVKAKV